MFNYFCQLNKIVSITNSKVPTPNFFIAIPSKNQMNMIKKSVIENNNLFISWG